MKCKTFRRAYAVDRDFGTIRRVLVDLPHLVFFPGDSWHTLNAAQTHYRFVFLPGEVAHSDWWDGWWESNWRLPDWSWAYGMQLGHRGDT